MGMMEGTCGVTPVYNLNGSNRNGDGAFGDGWVWIIFLFFLLCWGGNGWGNGFGGNMNGGVPNLFATGVNGITNEFLFTNLNGSLGRLQDQNTYLSNSLQQGLCNLGYSMQSGFADVASQMASCCCETNRSIDSVRYEASKNACDIITNQNMNTRDLIAAGNANTQRIVDLITQDKIESLRTELQAAQLQLSNNSQTTALINQLKSTPIPAYLTCSPYTNYQPIGLASNVYSTGCYNQGTVV